MELAEMIGLRPLPCAGLLVAVTSRCPLSCAHCSTSATMAGGQMGGRGLVRFVRGFGGGEPPRLVLFTGGEPLLRPGLVARLADEARSNGVRSAVLTGAFFARERRMPDPVRRVVASVDHFSVSIDAYHEREVARADVFRLLGRVLGLDVAVSLHIAGTGGDDPYLAEATAHVRREFGDLVPMLVSEIRPVGRAAGWSAATARSATPGGVSPCAMAAWPVVAADGTVTACCNQDVVDGRPTPAHLRLGHIDADDWATVRARSCSSPLLRMIRGVGPQHLRDLYAVRGATAGEGGYCDTCRALGDRPGIAAGGLDFAAGPAGALLDREAARRQAEAGPLAFVRRYACARYAELATLPGRSRALGP